MGPPDKDGVLGRVLVGNDSWLFLYAGDQRQFDYLLTKKNIDVNCVTSFWENIATRAEICERSGIQYLHVIFPSKPLLFTGGLPKSFENVESIYEREYLQAGGGLRERVIYPIAELKGLGRRGLRKYDTHYSDLGSLTVVNLILRKLNIDIDASINFNKSIKDRSGDLARMLSWDAREEELVYDPVSKKTIREFDNQDFLPGNTNNIVVAVNLNALIDKRVLIFGDSFFKFSLKFISSIFSHVLYVRSRCFHLELVQMFKPDVVLTGNAERYMNSILLDRHSSPFMLSLYGCPEYSPSASFRSAIRAELSYGHYRKIFENWWSSIHSSSAEHLSREDATIEEILSDVMSNLSVQDGSYHRFLLYLMAFSEFDFENLIHEV